MTSDTASGDVAPAGEPALSDLHDASERELLVGLVGAADRRRAEATSGDALVEGERRIADLEDALVSELRARHTPS